MDRTVKVIVIGGSAGSLSTLFEILKAVPQHVDVPIIIVLHRLRNVVSEMDKILSQYTNRLVVEPDDKDPLKKNVVYLAPQNYHLLVEEEGFFSLDYSEVVQYSRPSIDVTFESVATVYASGVLAILLSGANSDGTAGVAKILEKKGTVVVQHPDTAQYAFMPENAIDNNIDVKVLTPHEIRDYLQSLK